MKRPTTELHIDSLIPYGRIELKRAFQKNYWKGLVISVLIHGAILGSYYAGEFLSSDDDIPVVSVKILKYSDLGPPPSIAALPPAPSVGFQTTAKPSIGTPVPVPDAEVSPEQTLATQTEMSNVPSPTLEDIDGGENVQITQDITIDDEPGMDEFVPVEKLPQVVKRVVPQYPEMAIRAGIQGTVWVKILVGKDGKPIKAVVVRSTAEMFDGPAMEAAMQFVFTPAYMNQGPVKVWVAFPFHFRLKDAAS